MDDQQQQLVKRVQESSYILVTVNSNPTFDQLASAIGLTLMFNKMNKYATAIFSGNIPSSLNFLNPETTFEKNTDSLRDFIISLDKDKADKLRYKIEDNFVKIFISPYHSAITEKDLVYSMGDYNVDIVVALGIVKREELDQVITEHGRILHDATVVTINTTTPSSLGTINWSDPKASSLSEMLVGLSTALKPEGLLDTQISNALLSGIIEETAQFSNAKTTSDTMSVSSKLLAAGANQELVAKELFNRVPPVTTSADAVNQLPEVDETKQTSRAENGALIIEHPVVAEPAKVETKPEVKPTEETDLKTGLGSGRSVLGDDKSFTGLSYNPDQDDDSTADKVLQPTPMMTHSSTIMGQTKIATPHTDSHPAGITKEVRSTSGIGLPPVQALNAQPVDLSKTDTVVDSAELWHEAKPQNGLDYGEGSNIEFSDPTPPPPVPPPITK